MNHMQKHVFLTLEVGIFIYISIIRSVIYFLLVGRLYIYKYSWIRYLFFVSWKII